MAKKLDNALNDILAKPLEEQAPPPMMPEMPPYDVRDDAKFNQNKTRLQPAVSNMDGLDPDEEPADKALVQIQHYFVNGEFEKANALIQGFRGMKKGSFFSWHHMNQLIDWVRNIYKYTNMKDLSRNYYNYEMAKDMEVAGVKDLAKVAVKEATVEKFVKEAQKVLNKKLKMR